MLYSLRASMPEQTTRPFYGEYAWAFDLLIDRPVGQDCAAIAAWFRERGVLPGATLLDAGCGTGRYAGELARRGYAVEGVDRSSELIETARRSLHGHSVLTDRGKLTFTSTTELEPDTEGSSFATHVSDEPRRLG